MSRITPFEAEQLQAKLARARNPKASAAQDAAKAEKHAAGMEKELSRQFCAWLTMKGIPFICAPTNKKSALPIGWPDVTAIHGCALWDFHARVACVELKVTNGRVSAEQDACHARLRAAKVPVCVAYNLQDAIAFVTEHLRLDKPL